MLADAVHVKAHRLGDLDLLEDLAEAISVADRRAGLGIRVCFCEGSYAEFHLGGIIAATLSNAGVEVSSGVREVKRR